MRSLDAAGEDLREAGVKPGDAVNAWLLLERGLVLKEYGRIEESIDVLAQAKDACASQAPSTLTMRVCGSLAYQRAAKGQRDLAREDIDEGLRVGGQLTIRDGAWHAAMARLKDAEGSLYFFQGELDKAEAAYRAALELREAAGDLAGVPDDYVNLGGVAYTRADYATAVSHYERALAAAKRARWLAREALGHSNLGQARLALGQHEMAAGDLEIACRLAEEGGFLDVLADSTRALAEAELARGKLDEALTQAELGIEHAVRSKNPTFVAMAHATTMDVLLAKMSRDRERSTFERARHHKDEACAILRQLGQNHAVESILKRFGQGSNATVDA